MAPGIDRIGKNSICINNYEKYFLANEFANFQHKLDQMAARMPNSIGFKGPGKQMEYINGGLLTLQALAFSTCGQGDHSPKKAADDYSGILAELEPAHESVCSFLRTGILPSGAASNRLERLVHPEMVTALFREIRVSGFLSLSMHDLTHLNPNEHCYSNVEAQLPRILAAGESAMLNLANSITRHHQLLFASTAGICSQK